MSGRFIMILVGVALVMPFFFLPHGIVATALLVVGSVALLLSLAEVGRQLFNDVRWLAHRIATKHVPPPR
jgi:hypothetical protein